MEAVKTTCVLRESVLPSDNTSYLIIPVPAPPLVVLEPTVLALRIQWADCLAPLGRIACLFHEPTPLTEAEWQAMMSNPAAAKSTRASLTCTACLDELAVYYRLKPGGEAIPRVMKNAIPIDEAPNHWTCKCGKSTFSLEYLKKGFHQFLRQSAPWHQGKVAGHTMLPMYEQGQLGRLHADFQSLIGSDPPEEMVQQFVHSNPIIWSFLSPVRLFIKPPILTKYLADFAVLTSQKILYFIELEKPGTRIDTKAGTFHKDVMKAFDQVRDWSVEVGEHRHAVLDQLELSSKDVLDVRYMVVAGLQRNVPIEVLAKLQQQIPTRSTVFYCFDELAALLHSVRVNLATI